MAAALMRAHHARSEAEPVLLDPWGDTLVPQEFKDALVDRALAERGALRTVDRARVLDSILREVAAYASIVLRSRYAEDRLEQAVREGVRQYVLVGAGLDSFVLRRPPFAAGLAVFEVDHPATQDYKRARLQACGIAEPVHTFFVAADLASESLASALRRAPFRFDQPAFFSWLGVTMYLTREANAAALRDIAACAAPASELVLTYIARSAFDAANAPEAFRRMQASVARMGEPFLTGFDPARMPDWLASLGFELVEDLDGGALARRYARALQIGLVPGAASRTALARRTAW